MIENCTDKKVEILNSYDNTEVLSRAFPVANPTPIETELEKKIQNRLLTGFENWNRGTQAWMTWGNILYTPDSLYNVHGVHLTLKEYQATSNLSFKSTSVLMGQFRNMIICGDWTAIHYDITSVRRETGESYPGSVMEFVKFRDYGDDLGTRVVEGWAGTRGADYAGLMHFQTTEEKAAQIAFMDSVQNYTIPDAENLAEKYPVRFPTKDNSPMAADIRNTILTDFDKWNQGVDAWSAWAESCYDSSYVHHTDKYVQTLAESIAAEREAAKRARVTRLYFENMLISGEWAAIHYRIRTEDAVTGEKTPSDRMEFLHFRKDAAGVKLTERWTK